MSVNGVNSFNAYQGQSMWPTKLKSANEVHVTIPFWPENEPRPETKNIMPKIEYKNQKETEVTVSDILGLLEDAGLELTPEENFELMLMVRYSDWMYGELCIGRLFESARMQDRYDRYKFFEKVKKSDLRPEIKEVLNVENPDEANDILEKYTMASRELINGKKIKDYDKVILYRTEVNKFVRAAKQNIGKIYTDNEDNKAKERPLYEIIKPNYNTARIYFGDIEKILNNKNIKLSSEQLKELKEIFYACDEFGALAGIFTTKNLDNALSTDTSEMKNFLKKVKESENLQTVAETLGADNLKEARNFFRDYSRALAVKNYAAQFTYSKRTASTYKEVITKVNEEYNKLFK